MIQLTERERMLRTYRRQEIDRIMMVDSAWNGTVRRWHQEGLPEDIDWRDYFGFDKPVQIGFDNSPRCEAPKHCQNGCFQGPIPLPYHS